MFAHPSHRPWNDRNESFSAASPANWDPRLKMGLVGFSVLAGTFCPQAWQPVVHTVLGGLICAGLWWAGMLSWRLFGTLLRVAMCVALLAAPLVWLHGARGWTELQSAVQKACLAYAALIWLVGTTSLVVLLEVMYAWRWCRLLVAVLAATLRYLHVLREDAGRLQRARAARSPHRPWWRPGDWSLHSTILGMLFIRSAQRAERVYCAMTARGYQGRPTLPASFGNSARYASTDRG